MGETEHTQNDEENERNEVTEVKGRTRIEGLNNKLRVNLISVYGVIYKSNFLFCKWLVTHFNTGVD